MPLVLVVTPGALDANSYATLADADAYALTLPVTNDWATATPEAKNAALVQATRLMDTLNFKGYRTNYSTQPLQWPRFYTSGSGGYFGIYAPGSEGMSGGLGGFGYDRNGWQVLPNQIHFKIRDACCEFAIRLISEDRAVDSGGLTPETVKIGSLDLGRLIRRPIPASVLEMVREFLDGGGQARLVRS